jgi:hypothetical protein
VRRRNRLDVARSVFIADRANQPVKIGCSDSAAPFQSDLPRADHNHKEARKLRGTYYSMPRLIVLNLDRLIACYSGS